MPRLIVIKGADEGKQFELTGDRVGVGRDAANRVRLCDTEADTVSVKVSASNTGNVGSCDQTCFRTSSAVAALFKWPRSNCASCLAPV